MKLANPNSDKATVLHYMIQTGSSSMRIFSWMEGYRTRISELRREYKILMNDKREKTTNRYGRKIHYYEHNLVDRKHAIEVYKKINPKETCEK